MVISKTPEQVEAMARAGGVLAEVLDAVEEAVAVGVTPKELDRIAEKAVRDLGAEPSFLGYHGFPATLCTSVNDGVVHGIPGAHPLKDGDVLSFDCGLILDGWHSDSARTVIVGKGSLAARRLVSVTKQALQAGIDQARAGRRLGDVGAAIQKVVESAGYDVIPVLVGHGIGRSMHEDPQVPNQGTPGRGEEIQQGWVIAIEPMVSAGSSDVRLRSDRWTLVTADGSLAAHFEHTVAVTDHGPRVLTRGRRARGSES